MGRGAEYFSVEGYNVLLSGPDMVRWAFTICHAVLHDHVSGLTSCVVTDYHVRHY